MRPLLMPTILAVAFLAGCDGYTSVGGKIVDGDGIPIRGATVSLWREGNEVGSVASDDGGEFYVAGTHEPTREGLCLITQQRGYADDIRELMSNKKHEGIRIVMEQQALIID